jgi:hypothetical protein
MAKKLYGAAAAAHAKKVGRRRRRKTSRALVRRGTTAVVSRRRRRRSTAVVAGRRRRSSGAFGSVTPLLKEMGWSAGYGYLDRGGSGSAVLYARALLEKVTPDSVVSSIGKHAARGLILHFGAKYVPGVPSIIRQTASRLGKAALLKFADNVGAAGFDLGQAASMQGDDDGYDNTMSGAMDADYDEEVGYDDDDSVDGDDDADLEGDDGLDE